VTFGLTAGLTWRHGLTALISGQAVTVAAAGYRAAPAM
jgi:hypothetical protein